MKRSLLLIAITLAACGTPATDTPPDAGEVDGAPWSPPDIDPPPELAVTFEQVLDVNTQSPPIGAYDFVAHGGKVYFGARRAGGDFALYASDDTVAGTIDVASRPTWLAAPRPVLSANGMLYLVVSDEVLGTELWVTDGTDAGTRVVADVWTGKSTGFRTLIGATNDAVYWIAGTPQGARLWRTDGTLAGSRQVGDVSVGATTSGPSAAVLGQKLYFGTTDGPQGAELYVTDGTAAGTHLVKDIRPGADSSSPATFAVVGTKVVFSADDGTHGQELWVTDGTAAGTSLVEDIQAGATGAINRFATLLYVHQGVAYLAADDGTHGSELWRTDGTAAGTSLVVDLRPGAASSSPRASASLGAKVLLSADDGVHGREPFVSNGTAAGTTLVADIGAGPAGVTTTEFAVVAGTAYFTADDGTHGSELWRTDGTAAGTALVVDLLPGAGTGAQGGVVATGDRVYFPGTGPMVRYAPYTTDGTAASTRALIPSAEPGATAPAMPGAFVAAGDKLFFAATDAAHGRELWCLDASGARLVRDLNPGELAGVAGDPIAAGTSVYFVGNDAAHGRELWTSDGTAAGTRLVKDLNPGPAQGAVETATQMVAFNGKIYFFGTDGSAVGWELYVTNGTAAGTSLVADLDPAPNNLGYSPRLLGAYDGMLLFNARDANLNGVFRYNPNGNAVTRISPRGLFAEELVVAAGKVYMSIAARMGEPAPNPGIYVSNGTAAGTTKIDDRRARQIFSLGATLGYFAGGEIYRSNGTAGSTTWVSDAGPPDGTSTDARPVELGGALYYVGGNGTTGTGLWRTDLTTGGTRLVRALGAGNSFSNAAPPVVLGERMYFAAGDGTTGIELWTSDGTEAGTVRVRDVWAGPRSSTPRGLATFAGALYMSLDDGVHGVEPWRLTVP